jgi:phosphoglycerate-specific signal transduction histidine kinase
MVLSSHSVRSPLLCVFVRQSIINDVLDLSRIESGKLVLESAPFSLLQCVENAAHLCWGMAQKKSLDLVYSIDDRVPDALVGDATHLQQVLINLIGNAVSTHMHMHSSSCTHAASTACRNAIGCCSGPDCCVLLLCSSDQIR